ncbi:hypothetical protein B0I35DRAFT_437078 [Stachybotrys elegans]|uniref:Uncharacterized protein n=1 Tax=Stachybotrys elegans TaxID=80388 RepID=A0A8K0SS19_9HYPO|nr:hypothetical protein B0I35DRAFT_437078 [Stachybotrys elegans]
MAASSETTSGTRGAGRKSTQTFTVLMNIASWSIQTRVKNSLMLSGIGHRPHASTQAPAGLPGPHMPLLFRFLACAELACLLAVYPDIPWTGISLPTHTCRRPCPTRSKALFQREGRAWVVDGNINGNADISVRFCVPSTFLAAFTSGMEMMFKARERGHNDNMAVHLKMVKGQDLQGAVVSQYAKVVVNEQSTVIMGKK